MSSKMVLLRNCEIENMLQLQATDGAPALPVQQTQAAKEKDLRQELNYFKKSQGTFNLAPKLLTPKYIQQKDIVCIVTQSACNHHSEDARELLTQGAHCEVCRKQWLGNGACTLPRVLTLFD